MRYFFYSNKIKEDNMILRFFMIGLSILLVIGIVWYTYKYINKVYPRKSINLLDEPTIIETSFERKYPPSQLVIPKPKKGERLGVTFGFKLFIEGASENENWGRRFDQLKPIIKFNPSIYYHPSDNYLEFGVQIQDTKFSKSNQTLKVHDLPVQKWLRVVAVFASNRIKVYINGKLIASRKLKNPPILENQYLSVGEENNNLKGILGPVIYWPYPLEDHLIQTATNELT